MKDDKKILLQRLLFLLAVREYKVFLVSVHIYS